jgi:hypothetical protein
MLTPHPGCFKPRKKLMKIFQFKKQLKNKDSREEQFENFETRIFAKSYKIFVFIEEY